MTSDYDRCFYEVRSVGESAIPCQLLRKGHEDYVRDARIEAHDFTGPPTSDVTLGKCDEHGTTYHVECALCWDAMAYNSGQLKALLGGKFEAAGGKTDGI